MKATAARVEELKNVYAAGQSATIGAINPYRGQIVSAAVWRAGYRKMIEAMFDKPPAMQGPSHPGNVNGSSAAAVF